MAWDSVIIRKRASAKHVPLPHSLLVLTTMVSLLALCLAGCAERSFTILLPNGYILSVMPEYASNIIDKDWVVVVGSRIREYAVVGKIVTGYVTHENVPSGFAKARTGYFLFDTANGDLLEGLNDEEWRDFPAPSPQRAFAKGCNHCQAPILWDKRG